jgi:hypothetical protein
MESTLPIALLLKLHPYTRNFYESEFVDGIFRNVFAAERKAYPRTEITFEYIIWPVLPINTVPAAVLSCDCAAVQRSEYNPT